MTTHRIFLLVCLLWCYACAPAPEGESATAKSPVDYVNPFMGTADHGHVYPGATVPFGMVQLSPDNGTEGWDWCSGYNWADSLIVGFSHTHLSGTGIGDLCDISVMPTRERIDLNRITSPRTSTYAASFSHDQETAQPGYYQVRLDNDIQVELTASPRVGLHRYRFPEGADAHVLIDLGFRINWDRPTRTAISVEEEGLVVGYRYSTGWAKDQRVYFAARFSQAFTSDPEIADSNALLSFAEGQNYYGQQIRAQFFFGEQTEVLVKVGLSSASVAGAIAALDEVPTWDFAATQQQARELWEKELSKIEVTSQDEDLKTTFYTSLYRTCLAPVLYADANNEYKGADSSIHQANGYTRYDIFSLWDTFRAAHPLFTLTQGERVNDFIRSMLAHYDEYGLLPVWSLLGNETNTMTGYHAIPVIADAYLKGFRDYDAEKAFAAMKKSAMQDIRATDHYRTYGYIPYDKAGQSVTRTLEYAFDDWCIAQMAKAMDKEEDYQTFLDRSTHYRAMFDTETGFMRAKMTDGSWKTPFDPQFSDHNFDVAEYTEGNAWQHSWFVPHAVDDLIALHGGKANFVQKLDSLFSVNSEIRGDNASVDISGLIGQYAHGNEPSHHIAYLYNYADRPDKTQQIVREITATQYNAGPTGLCGNEDCGQMSAWYVFSTLGLYPVNPASGLYDLGSPHFPQASIHLPNGKTFTIQADGVTDTQMYVQSIQLNGEPYGQRFISHDQIMQGGTLAFSMAAKPAQ